MPLTMKQQVVLEYVGSHCATWGFPPTAREISDDCGLGGATSAHRILRVLRDAGLIDALPGRSRAIRVVRKPVPPVSGVHAAMLRCAAAVHGRVRDRVLLMAARIDSPSIKSDLITDCARRHELVQEVLDATSDSEVSAVPCLDVLGRLAGAVPSTRAWDVFVVDFLVFNTVTADCASALAPQLPQTEACLSEIANVGRAATVCGQRWAAQLPSCTGDNLIGRAEAVRRLCMRAWASAAQNWP